MMRLTSVIASLVLLAGASASCVGNWTDLDLFEYILKVENALDTFFKVSLANLTMADFEAGGYTADEYYKVSNISYDISYLVGEYSQAISKLGGQPFGACEYAFHDVTNVTAFLKTAADFTGIRASAAIGALPYLSDNSHVNLGRGLGMLLATEDHNNWLRTLLGQNPFPQPWRTPLSFHEMSGILSAITISCPATVPTCSLTPPMYLRPSGVETPPYQDGADSTVVAGSTVTLVPYKGDSPLLNGSSTLYAAFLSVWDPIFSSMNTTDNGYEIVVPKGVNGQSYVVLSTDGSNITSESTVAIGSFDISNVDWVAAST